MRGIEGKVVVLGSKGVGKTRLVTNYIKNTLHRDVGPDSAVVASFFTCKIILEDVKIQLQIWDTAGQERFKAVAPMYFRNANAAILVFDLSDRKTFTEIKGWIQELHRNVPDPLILTLVGNKLDLNVARAVTNEEAYQLAASMGASYFETSAETDQGLDQVFVTTALGLVRLANEGKSRTLRQFASNDSIPTYTNNNTAFSNAFRASSDAAFHLHDVDVGIPVEGDDVKVDGVGRLEMTSWSIANIALGEVERVGWCW